MANPKTDYAIVPALNEGRTIKEILKRLRDNTSFKPIVVDDGSTDNTYKLAKSMRAMVLRHEVNRGKGEAIKTGLSYVLGKKDVRYITIIDSDMQYPPEEASKLAKVMEETKADFVSGYRRPSEIPYANRFGNFIWKTSFNILFGTDFKDTNCGLIAFNKKAGRVVLNSSYGGYIIDNAIRMQISKSGLKIGQAYVKVHYGGRVVSKFARMAFGNMMFILIEGFKYRIRKL